MLIGFCFNIKKNLPSTDPASQIDAEFDAPETIGAIKKALESVGHKVIEIEANQEAYLKLFKLRKKIDIVFNIAEGFYGDAREAQIPAMCDMLEIAYTHSSALTQAISLNKALTKQVLIYNHIKTPDFQLISFVDEQIKKLKFPLLIKPNSEGSSKGIRNDNLIDNSRSLVKSIKRLLKEFDQSVLVEEFLNGREFTIALLGNPPEVLPIIEQRLDRLPRKYQPISSYEVKWLWEDTLPDPKVAYDCPAKIDKILQKKLTEISLATFTALNCRDCARIDIRLDSLGEPQVLEVNTLPGMIPDKNVISYLPIAARAAGYSFETMVLAILDAARKRYRLPSH